MPEFSIGPNGGFPEPRAGEPVRIVDTAHDACGASTRVRLPKDVPARAVRRVVCSGCAGSYDVTKAEDRGVLTPRPREVPARRVQRRRAAVLAAGGPSLHMPSLPQIRVPSLPPMRMPEISVPGWLSDPSSKVWRWASIPVAAAAVVVGLTLIQGDDHPADAPPIPIAPAATDATGRPAPDGAAAAAAPGGGAELVRESHFTLALPAGWARVHPPDGATFAAIAGGGEADATLWIEDDPKLSFKEFEAQSLERLRQLDPSARIADRVAAPTPGGTVVRLATSNAPHYEVVLRAFGSRLYYLATTVKPAASPEVRSAAALIQGSLVPQGGN